MSDRYPSYYYGSLLNEFYWNIIEERRITQYMIEHQRARSSERSERENVEETQNTELGAVGPDIRETPPSPSLSVQLNEEQQETVIDEVKRMNYSLNWESYKVVRDVSCQAENVLTYGRIEVRRHHIRRDSQREVGTQVVWPFTDDDQNESRQFGDAGISPQHNDSYHNQSSVQTQTHNDQPESSNAQPRLRNHEPTFNGLTIPAWSQEHNNPWPQPEVCRESSGASSQVNDIYSAEMYQPNQQYPSSHGFCHNFPLMTFRPLSSAGGFQEINSYMAPGNFPQFPPPYWNYRPQPTCFYDPSSRRPLAFIIPGRPVMLAQNIDGSNPLLPSRPLQINNQMSARNNTNRYNSRPGTQPQCSTNEGAQTSKNIKPKKRGKKHDA